MGKDIAVLEAPSYSLATESPRILTALEVETIRFHLSNARSDNTKAAYFRHWKKFTAWCERENHRPFPAEVSVVILYLSHLNDQQLRLSSIEQALSAIVAVMKDNVHLLDGANPVGFRHPHITAALSSIRRQIAQRGQSTVKKPRFFTQAEVRKMAESCPATSSGLQDKTLLLLGANTGLRASEFVRLTIGDLTITDRGVDVFIANSKTDQYGEGQKVFVARLAPHLRNLDACAALDAWIAKRKADILSADPEAVVAEEPVFIAYRKGGTTAHLLDGKTHSISRETVSTMVSRCAARAGLEESSQSISSHSMRHTMISVAFSQHVDSTVISLTSRHKNLKSLMEYNQTSRMDSAVSIHLWK